MSNTAILVVCGSDQTLADVCSALRDRGYVAVPALNSSEAVSSAGAVEAVVLVLPLCGETARTCIERLKAAESQAPVIVHGRDSDIASPIQAFELGAYEYLEELGPRSSELLATIGAMIGARRGDLQLRYLRQKEALPGGWETIRGSSAAMRDVIVTLQRVCRRISTGSTPTILLNGETGTGKGFVSKCIHYNSARRNRPFIEVNCAALPPSLMEAELFGHERGAFTDAKTARSGLFETAHGGTLFLDEIAAVPLDLQAKLLTAIEEKRVRRVGGRQSSQINVQIIAATHEDLERRAREGSFRYDLFHRLNVVSIVLPALRDRGNDVVSLAESFVASICREYGIPPRRLSDCAKKWILRYSWPGNVRELRNRIERILLLEDDEVLRAEHFGAAHSAGSEPVQVQNRDGEIVVSLPENGVPLEELERAVISEALLRTAGNVSQAARFLSISRQTLIYRMKKYQLSSGSGVETPSGTFAIAARREPEPGESVSPDELESEPHLGRA